MPDWKAVGKMRLYALFLVKNHYSSGTIEINHKTYPNRIHSAMERGIAFVPAERKVEGLFLKQDIAWNTTIASLKRICKMNTLSKKEEMKRTELYIQQLHTKTNGTKTKCFSLKWRKSAESHVIQMDHDRGRCVSSGRAYPWY